MMNGQDSAELENEFLNVFSTEISRLPGRLARSSDTLARKLLSCESLALRYTTVFGQSCDELFHFLRLIVYWLRKAAQGDADGYFEANAFSAIAVEQHLGFDNRKVYSVSHELYQWMEETAADTCRRFSNRKPSEVD